MRPWKITIYFILGSQKSMETILCVLEYQFMWRRTCFLYEKKYYQFNVYFVISSYKTVVKNILMCVRESSTLYYMVAHSLHDCTTVWQENSHQFRGARITTSPCHHNLSLILHRTSPSSHFGKLSLLAPVPGSRLLLQAQKFLLFPCNKKTII